MENEIVNTVTQVATGDLIWGNPFVDWIRAAIIFAIVILASGAIKFVAKTIYRKHFSEKDDEITFRSFLFSNIAKLNFLVAIFIALYPAIISLVMPSRVDRIAKYLFIIAAFGQILIWASNTLELYGKKYLQQHPDSATAMNVFSLMWKIAAYTIILLVMLDQLGFNINALIAGLGVGGIAVAFALQNVLGDVFGSLAIIFDKPFKVGDVIQIGTFIGRVEKVGLKTTRIRSQRGEQLVFSNNEILKSTIQNYGDLQERRVSMLLGVTYETPFETLKKVPEVVREAIFSRKNTSVDHVTLKEFAESSINFEVWYYIRITEEQAWPEIEHEINLEIVRLFEKEGISFAYPTRTVYTKSL